MAYSWVLKVTSYVFCDPWDLICSVQESPSSKEIDKSLSKKMPAVGATLDPVGSLAPLSGGFD